jgi:hypothetical protein
MFAAAPMALRLAGTIAGTTAYLHPVKESVNESGN